MLKGSDARVRLKSVVRHVAELRERHASVLGCVDVELDRLIGVIDADVRGEAPEVDAVRTSLEALLYLRNPYDNVFDFSDSGFADDIEEIREAHAKLGAPSFADP